MSQNPNRRRRSPYGIAIALAIVAFVLVFPEVNEGTAMAPSIVDGQTIVVHKTSFSAKRGAPDRESVVVLDKEYSTDIGASDNIISRVIGLPGDHVVLRDGKVYINDKEYSTELGIAGCNSDIDIDVTLKDSQVFLLNDNRTENGFDSTNKAIGPLNMSEIKGNAIISVWPLNSFGGI